MFYPFFTNPVSIIQHRCRPSQCLLHVLGSLSAPPVAGRLEWPSSREKIVARGSWLVARKSLPLYSNQLWSNLSGGLPTGSPYNTATQAVFFANCDRRTAFISWICRGGTPHLNPKKTTHDSRWCDPKKLDLGNETVFTVSLLFYAVCRKILYWTGLFQPSFSLILCSL